MNNKDIINLDAIIMLPLVIIAFIIPFSYRFIVMVYHSLYYAKRKNESICTFNKIKSVKNMYAFLLFFEITTWQFCALNLSLLVGILYHCAHKYINNSSKYIVLFITLSFIFISYIMYWSIKKIISKKDIIKKCEQIISYIIAILLPLLLIAIYIITFKNILHFYCYVIISNGFFILWWLFPGFLYKPFRQLDDFLIRRYNK